MAANTKKIEVHKTREITGVEYSRQHGVRCPGAAEKPCGFARPAVYSTGPWEAGIKIRYHKCQWCGVTFKSIETDLEDSRQFLQRRAG